MNKEIPCIFYLYIHSKIYEKSKGSDMKIKDMKSYLRKWRIPKRLIYLIIKELEILELIKLNGRRRVNIKKPIFSDNDIDKYYIKMNIYPCH